VKDSVYRAPKGTRDLVWPDSERRRSFINLFAEIAGSSGYAEIVLPMFEHREVFQRLGDGTDVVRKEMYDFEDKGGRNIALRPEQTASIVRSYVENRPSLPWKVWYAGPNFRYERAQKGRFRQFDQVGLEALGPEDPHLDIEVIAIAWRFYEALGLRKVNLQLNSIGTSQDRVRYIEALSQYLENQKEFLSKESQDTFAVNPLRVLDSKRDEDVQVISEAPSILDHLSDGAQSHFNEVQEGLEKLAIPYIVKPTLVRGLDYYVKTTFEFTSESIDAAQDAIGGGGRYDGLAAEMGAPETPGVGFALGLDRTLMACDAEKSFPEPEHKLEIFVVDTTGGANALVITDELRQEGFKVDRSFDDRSMKAQMKAADKSGAKIAVIVGDDEVSNGVVTIRDLRGKGGQEEIASESMIADLRKKLR